MIHILGIKEFREGGKYFIFIEGLKLKYGYDDSIERSENEFHKQLVIFLSGIHEGKWDTKTESSKVLGKHIKYLSHVHNRYKNVFNAVNSLIGFPSPNVVRYHKYYDNIENCKNELENIIKIYSYLPSHSDLNNNKSISHKQILKTIYAKYKIREFKKGGAFYLFIKTQLKMYSINRND